jgi:hypothetical protein
MTLNEIVKGTQDALVVVVELNAKLNKKGATSTTERARYSRDENENEDTGVAVLLLAVYAVYDEGFEKDGAVL